MSSFPSSSSTLVSSGDSQAVRKGTSPGKSYVSFHDEWTSGEIRFIFRDVKSDPMPSMVMLQMIADAYEERHRVWEFNKNRPRQKGDDPTIYGPVNEAQKNVEDFLVEWRFLSGPSTLDKETLMTDSPALQKTDAYVKELTQLTSSEIRHHRTNKPLKPNASMKIRHMLQNLYIGKMPQVQSVPKRSRKKEVPGISARRLRPVFAALPRIDPGYQVKQLKQMSLRHMTRADSCALRACSVRKRKFTPAPEYQPTAEFLAELHPLPRRFIPTREPRIQHDELKTLSWMHPPARRQDSGSSMTSNGKTKVISVDDRRSHTSPFLSLVIYLLIQLTILAFCVVGAFVALWTLSCTIHRCFQRCLSPVLGLPPPPEEDTDY